MNETTIKFNFETTLNDIVDSLEGNWKVKDYTNTEYVKSATISNGDFDLWIMEGGYGLKDQFKIRGQYKKIDGRIVALYNDEDLEDSMKCSNKKTGEVIAKSITKRILPAVIHNTNETNKKYLADLNAHSSLHFVKKEYKDLGLNRHNIDEPYNNKVSHYEYDKGQDFDIDLGYDGTEVYQMTINKITHEQAKEIVKILMK